MNDRPMQSCSNYTSTLIIHRITKHANSDGVKMAAIVPDESSKNYVEIHTFNTVDEIWNSDKVEQNILPFWVRTGCPVVLEPLTLNALVVDVMTQNHHTSQLTLNRK